MLRPDAYATATSESLVAGPHFSPVEKCTALAVVLFIRLGVFEGGIALERQRVRACTTCMTGCATLLP